MVLGGLELVLGFGMRFFFFLSFPPVLYLVDAKFLQLEDFEQVGKLWLEVCAEVAKE